MTFFLLFCAGDGRYWQICSPFYLPCSQTLSVRRLIPLAECFLTGWSSFLLKEEEEEESAVVLIGGHLLNPVGNRLRRQRHPWCPPPRQEEEEGKSNEEWHCNWHTDDVPRPSYPRRIDSGSIHAPKPTI